jgi:hypothetical protein
MRDAVGVRASRVVQDDDANATLSAEARERMKNLLSRSPQ